ncbi:signal peptide protein [Cupriavidus sp. 2TAF22]
MGLPMLLAAAVCVGVPLLARAQTAPAAQAPTGICKDGSNYFGATKQGACAGHGGVKEWRGATAASAPAAAAAPAAPAAAKAAVPTPAAGTAPAPATSMAKPATPGAAAPATTASVGAAGQVWVNKTSKVYHCAGSRWYGKTKDGAYMSESQATAQGFHADHGKACG